MDDFDRLRRRFCVVKDASPISSRYQGINHMYDAGPASASDYSHTLVPKSVGDSFQDTATYSDQPCEEGEYLSDMDSVAPSDSISSVGLKKQYKKSSRKRYGSGGSSRTPQSNDLSLIKANFFGKPSSSSQKKYMGEARYSDQPQYNAAHGLPAPPPANFHTARHNGFVPYTSGTLVFSLPIHPSAPFPSDTQFPPGALLPLGFQFPLGNGPYRGTY